MLVDFVEGGVTPQQMRKEIAQKVDSGRRTYKIAGTVENHGAYAQPIAWTMTIADVVAAGHDAYYESVNAWARATLAALRG
jgi:NADH:ubiquinone oxidoreductase subunit F (NADH-binding)